MKKGTRVQKGDDSEHYW